MTGFTVFQSWGTAVPPQLRVKCSLSSVCSHVLEHKHVESPDQIFDWLTFRRCLAGNNWPDRANKKYKCMLLVKARQKASMGLCELKLLEHPLLHWALTYTMKWMLFLKRYCKSTRYSNPYTKYWRGHVGNVYKMCMTDMGQTEEHADKQSKWLMQWKCN